MYVHRLLVPSSGFGCLLVFSVVLGILCQQHCRSAALSSHDQGANGVLSDESGAYAGNMGVGRDRVDSGKVGGRDLNISKNEVERASTSGRSHRLQTKVKEMEDLIKGMRSEIRALKKYLPTGKCSLAMCPVGSMKYGCDCLLFVHRDLTWTDASSYCSSMSGKLVTVHSKGIQKHIKAFLTAQLGHSGVHKAQVYTGLIYTKPNVSSPSFVSPDGFFHTKGSADGWYWVSLNGSTTRLNDHGYNNWADKHPHPGNITVFKESCMHLEGNDRFKWVSSHCTTTKRFICHFSAVPKRQRKPGHSTKDDGNNDGHNDSKDDGEADGDRNSRGKNERKTTKHNEQKENG